jgi:hypothetical protein
MHQEYLQKSYEADDIIFSSSKSRNRFLAGSMGLDHDPTIHDQRIPL